MTAGKIGSVTSIGELCLPPKSWCTDIMLTTCFGLVNSVATSATLSAAFGIHCPTSDEPEFNEAMFVSNGLPYKFMH